MGRRTGGAVVVTETAEQAELGLERNRHYIGPRYVEVTCLLVNTCTPFNLLCVCVCVCV